MPPTPTLPHKALIDLLQRAYSAEKAAAFAYQGHAVSVKDKEQKAAIRQIEIDEWHHRENVLAIMQEYNIPVSKYYEAEVWYYREDHFFSCYIIGWFMPYYFAGKLESGNVCEYFRMMQYFHELGIVKHNEILYEMGIKEKEHEVYFLSRIKNKKMLPVFEKMFSWGARRVIMMWTWRRSIRLKSRRRIVKNKIGKNTFIINYCTNYHE